MLVNYVDFAKKTGRDHIVVIGFKDTEEISEFVPQTKEVAMNMAAKYAERGFPVVVYTIVEVMRDSQGIPGPVEGPQADGPVGDPSDGTD